MLSFALPCLAYASLRFAFVLLRFATLLYEFLCFVTGAAEPTLEAIPVTPRCAKVSDHPEICKSICEEILRRQVLSEQARFLLRPRCQRTREHVPRLDHAQAKKPKITAQISKPSCWSGRTERAVRCFEARAVLQAMMMQHLLKIWIVVAGPAANHTEASSAAERIPGPETDLDPFSTGTAHADPNGHGQGHAQTYG